MQEEPAGRGFEPILAEMSRIIAGAQSALLDGRMADLEQCIMRERELCREFQLALPADDLAVAQVAIDTRRQAAERAREQNRVFSAVLRRMRRNLEVLRNLRRSCELAYGGVISARGQEV